jgi:predicted outer membrane protein
MNTDRRTLLTGAAAALVAVPTMAMAQRRVRMMKDPAAMPMPDVSGTRTSQQFTMGVIGPAMLSLATSQIAVDRARKADAREFAGFELTEAIAVTTVLKQLGTPVPPMDAKAQATLDKIRSAAPGAAFDRAYIDAQYENHVFLRDLATAYLGNSPPNPNDMAEMQGRHLATLALATFKEHTMITQRIAHELRA